MSTTKIENEIWKDLLVDKEDKDTYKGLYQVSNLGRVRSLTRWVKNGENTGYYKEGKIIKAGKHSSGYLQVNLSCNGVTKMYRVHRLVAMAFIGDIIENEIDHINRKKDDNRVENLRITNRVENNRNKGLSKANKSGYTGICLHKATNKWTTYINIDGKRKNLGYYDDIEVARLVRIQAEQEYYNSNILC